MPREATITYEQVAALADSIKASGAKPTPRMIRERHGSGSLGTVHRHFQKWQANQERQVETTLALPSAIQRSILDFMGQELAGAKAALQTELAEAQQAAADLATENERQANRIEALQTDIDNLQSEKATLEGRIAQMEADLKAARDEATRERQAAEAARTEVAKAQLRLEAMPRLEKENERLQTALDAERKARTDAERQMAGIEAKAEGLTARFADVQEQKQRSADIIGKLEGVIDTLQRQIAGGKKGEGAKS